LPAFETLGFGLDVGSLALGSELGLVAILLPLRCFSALTRQFD